MTRRSPISTLFPYTTLFRSQDGVAPHDFYSTSIFPTDVRVRGRWVRAARQRRSEEHTSELQSHSDNVCRLLLAKKKRTRSAKATSAGCALRYPPPGCSNT